MTTRLIIKNLPPDCTEQKLRKFFKSYGQLTDCTLKYTKEGKFRKFAFVGFESDDAGEKALNGTNQTYMGTARVQVEKCLPFGDSNKPRPWSKYSDGSSAYKRKNAESQGETSQQKPAEPEKKKKKVDPKWEAYLEAKGEKVEKEIDMESLNIDQSDNSQLLKELLEGITGDTKLSLIVTGLPSSIKQNSLKEWLSPVRVKAMKIVRNDKTAVAFVSFNRPPDVRRALQRDQQFLGGFKLSIQKVQLDEKEGEEEEDEAVDEATTYDRATEEAKARDEILETGRLFVRNLPFSTKEPELQALFKKYGEVADIEVIVDKQNGKCKGFAIVEFVFPESAVAAYAAEDGKVFKGRMLHILPGAEKRDKPSEADEDKDGKSKNEEKSSFKKEKAAKMKANAGKTHSWNTLFLGPNAVAETLAEKLGVEKSDLLLGENGESAGVRMALAETRLVREVKDFLVANGVKLDAFSRPASKRSDTVIIVKNLPANVEEDEIRRMFERSGQVEKVLMPPEAAVSALVVMNNAVEAKKAFKALAYSRFRTQPLYLEWAPGDVFGEDDAKKKEKKKKEKPSEVKDDEPEEEKPKKNKRDMTYEEKIALRRNRQAQKQEVPKEEPDEEEEEPEPEDEPEPVKVEEPIEEEEDVIESDSTIFVKNLAFDTTDAQLDALFRKNYRIKSAQISKKLNPANPAKSLSMGFGFVQFFTQAEAKKAIKEMQGEMLDGHSLDLKLSNRAPPNADGLKRKSVTNTKQANSTKLIVRNIPFQAKIQEVESLFATFGEIRGIRIPKKVGTKDDHRGFGFVDFVSAGEAKRAFEALSQSTHLYGRRLVLEWAKEEESLEEMREKTAEKFSGEQKQMKKQKQKILEIEKELARIDDD